MREIESLERVVDRLQEWFFGQSRATVAAILREEKLRYQMELCAGNLSARTPEHGAFEQLRAVRENHADLLADIA